MKKVVAALCALGLAVPVAAQAATVPAAKVTISNVSGANYSLTHGTGWAWSQSSGGCTVNADVNETPIAPPNTPTTGTVQNTVGEGTLVGHNPVNLTLTDPTAQNTIDSITSLSTSCRLQRTYTQTTSSTVKTVKTQKGTSKTWRKATAYSPGGNCNWGGDGQGGGISTCLVAHINVTYKFVLPIGAKYGSFTHTVTAGIEPCKNKQWTVSHVGRTYSATFHHGSSTGFSQCDIHSVSLHYSKTTTKTVQKTQYATVSSNWP